MEEIVMFLQDRGISCCLQEAMENCRCEPWTPGSMLLRFSLTKSFSHSNLEKTDPDRWVFMDGSPLSYLGGAAIPDGFVNFMDWFFVVEPQFTDRRGWKYHLDVQNGVLLPTRGSASASADHKFRMRRWQRVVIEEGCEERGHLLVEEELNAGCNAIRCLSPAMIGAALGNIHQHQMQFVMESQRRSDANKPFSPAQLTDVDPPFWASGSQENLTDDPSRSPSEALREVVTSELNTTNGWIALHEFLFIVYPRKDEEGWEYNKDFTTQFAEEWHAEVTALDCVRRRVWMRPCVRDENLNACRDLLRRYIAAHPRGIVKQGRLQRQSHYRKRWCNGTAVLTDTKLEISLENNYQGVVVYDLLGCEVVSDFDTDDTTGHSFRFGLRMIDQVLEKTQEMRCILNARSRAEQLEWVTVLSRQVSQVNLSFWALTFGPPIHNAILIQGNMWKQGSLHWQYRKFELHGDGVLSYWKENILKGKIKLCNCAVDGTETSGHPFSFTIKKKNGYCLVLRTSDEATKTQWIEAIRCHMSSSHSPVKAILPLAGSRPRQKSLTEVPKLSLSPEKSTEGVIENTDNPQSDGSEKEEVQKPEHEHEHEQEHELQNSTPADELNRSSITSEVESSTATDTLADTAKTEPDTHSEDTNPTPDSATTTSPQPSGASGAGGLFSSSLPPARRATVGAGAASSTPSSTHTVGVNKITGRRVSVLSEAFKAELDHQSSGIWEASDDSDSEDSDCSDMSRTSSFVDISASRQKSVLASLFSAANVPHDNEEPASWMGGELEEPNANSNTGPTHQVLKDNKGRRVSVLNDTILDSAQTNNGQWGGFDSDESDGEQSRASSMSSTQSDALHLSVGRPHSRVVSSTCKAKQPQTIPEREEGESGAVSPKKSMASTVSEFISKRRNSLF